MMLQFQKICLTALVFLVFPLASVARPTLEVKEDLYIYRKPIPSKPVLILQTGQSVPVSRKRYGKDGEYLRVVVPFRGKKRGGYVRVDDLKDSFIATEESEQEHPGFSPSYGENGMDRPNYYGLAVGALFYLQGASELESDSEQQFSVSKLTGIGYPVSFFLDFAMSDTWSLATWVSYRSLEVSGSAGVVLGDSVSSTSDFSRAQNQIGFGLGFKYFGEASRLWYGSFVELGKVISSKLAISGQAEVESEASSIPLKFVLGGSLGYEWGLSKDWYVLPELRFGVVVNGDPIATTVQILIPIAATF